MHSPSRASGYLTLTSQFAHHPACCLADVVDTVRLRQARRRSTPCLIMAERCNSARTYRFRRTLPLSSSPGDQDFWYPVFFTLRALERVSISKVSPTEPAMSLSNGNG